MNFLYDIGFNDNTISIFRDSIIINKDLNKISFSSFKSSLFPNFNCETLTITKQRFTPGNFFNIINPLDSSFIFEVYFFSSFLDAMAFYQLKQNLSFENALFVITGSNPKYYYFDYLKSHFINLFKFYFVFPNSFYGKLLDIKLASFICGNKNLSFFLNDNFLTIYYNNKSFFLNRNILSLSMARKGLNIPFPYKTFKSKVAVSFFDELILTKNLIL